MNDAELMQAYVKEGSQEAFETLVNQYAGLVYAACWRQLRDRHEAEDATQAVFLLLSQNAKAIRQDRAAGWLLTAARYACANIRRSRQRRERREQVVAMDKARDLMKLQEENLAGMLDAGLEHLGAADREALVLRYLREQSFEEVGKALGISTEAARKRVDRGVDKLRRHFQKQGITTHSAAVSALLVNQLGNTGLTQEGLKQMVQGVLHVARTGGQASASSVSIAKGTKSMMWVSKMKTAAAVAGVVALAVAGTGWALTAVMTGNERGIQVAAATDVGTRPQAAAVVDLSTPENAINSFCRAVEAGDRAKAYSCLTADPNRPATALDVFLTWNFAENRLLQAARKKFGDDAEELRRGPTFDTIARMWKDNPTTKTVIDGDNASIQGEIPEAIVNMLPEEMQTIVKQWSGKPLRFHKVNGQWKVDLDGSMRVAITLSDDNAPGTVDQEKRGMVVVADYAKILDEMAQGVDQGTWKTLNTTRSVMDGKRAELSNTYKFRSMEIAVRPADSAKTP